MKVLSIGTTISEAVVEKRFYEYCDVLIVNNSANVVYVCESPNEGTAAGIPLAANGGSYEDRFNDRDLYLIASGAASDVRLSAAYYSKTYSVHEVATPPAFPTRYAVIPNATRTSFQLVALKETS